MLPVLIAVGAGLLALAASHKGADVPDSADPKAPKAGTGKAKPVRRMSASEAFEAGKKARDAEFKLKADEDAAFAAKVDAAVKARGKSEPPASAPAKIDPPKTEEGAA
jgi:hypothetical protein